MDSLSQSSSKLQASRSQVLVSSTSTCIAYSTSRNWCQLSTLFLLFLKSWCQNQQVFIKDGSVRSLFLYVTYTIIYHNLLHDSCLVAVWPGDLWYESIRWKRKNKRDCRRADGRVNKHHPFLLRETTRSLCCCKHPLLHPPTEAHARLVNRNHNPIRNIKNNRKDYQPSQRQAHRVPPAFASHYGPYQREYPITKPVHDGPMH